MGKSIEELKSENLALSEKLDNVETLLLNKNRIIAELRDTLYSLNKSLESKMVKEYYTLAKKVKRTYGHGDYGKEFNICPIDAYHTNSKEFHPLFETKKEAEKYKIGLHSTSEFHIVKLKKWEGEKK